MSNITTPDWVKNAVFYQIFPDRFAKSDKVHKPANLETWDSAPTNYGFKGGDLLGIAEHLDYLHDLGINALYLNPIFQSTANHRYHTQDYFRVDPILGGDEAFQALLKAAHKRKMRVIIDGVFNHASRGFYQFNHSLENEKDSPYLDWFLINNFPLNAYNGKANYNAWWGIPALPKFNVQTPAVREFLFKVAEYWIKQGVDGWRLDVAGEIDDDGFWQEFRRRVKGINPDAYIVGEIWHEAQRWLRGDQFDGVMNYQFTQAVLGFTANGKIDTKLAGDLGYAPVRDLDASAFAYCLNINLGRYDRAINQAQLNSLDSHDTPRFVNLASGDRAAFKLGTLIQMTYPGAPCVYYGDEIGLTGGRDPECRRAFPWEEPRWDMEMRDYVKACIAMRHKYAALRTGEFQVIYAEGQAVVYCRKSGDEKLIIAINSGSQAVDASIVTRDVLPDGTALQVIFGNSPAGRKARFHTVNGSLTGVTIPKREGLVLKAL